MFLFVLSGVAGAGHVAPSRVASSGGHTGFLATPSIHPKPAHLGETPPLTSGPLALSISTTGTTVCAFGSPTCSDAPASLRVHLSVAAPAVSSGNSTPVEILYLIDVSPYTVACGGSDGGCPNGATPLAQTFRDSAWQIASALAVRHPGRNLSFGLAITDSPGGGSYDDGDGNPLAVIAGNFTNSSQFGAVVNRSFVVPSDIDSTDNQLQNGGILAMYSVFTGQTNASSRLVGGTVHWNAGADHVVVWMAATAPQDANYSEDICPLATEAPGPGCALGNGTMPTCAPSLTLSGGPMPNCEGWVSSQNGNPRDSIAALAFAGAGCLNSTNLHCTVDSVIANATPSNPAGKGWAPKNATAYRISDVLNDTRHVVASGCDLALATGGSWDGPQNSTCGNASGTLPFTSNLSDPQLLNSLSNVSLGSAGAGGGVAAPVAGRAMFRLVTTPAFGPAPVLNASTSCSTSTGTLPDCPSVPAVGEVSGSTVLAWNWSTAVGHDAMGVGDTWSASFDLVATQGPTNASPLDVCATPGCPLVENASGGLGFRGVDFAVGGDHVELSESFPLVNVSIAAPANLTASISAPVTAADAPATLGYSISTAGGYPPFTARWQFGDGTTGSGALTVQHTYLGAGFFNVRVEVTDAVGAVAPAQTWVVVDPALQATVNATTEAGTAPLFVGFTAQVRGGEPPYVVDWNFGSGGPANGTTASYEFTAAGSYEVQVHVTDAFGGGFNATVPVSVGPAPAVVPLPLLSVNATALAIVGSGCGDSAYRFAFSASASGGVAPYTYLWKFGDGTVGGGPLVDHAFAGSVPQPIATVTVTDSNGTTATGGAVYAPVPAAEHTCPATALGSVISTTELEIGALGLAIAATVAAVVLWRRE